MPSINNRLNRTSHVRLALFLIIIGSLFGIDTIVGIPIIYKLWPILISFLSIGFFGIFFTRQKLDSLFLGIGIYLFCFSILALYCNFTSWSSMKFLWPLFILFLGVVFFNIYFFCKQSRINIFLGILFISLSSLFFLVFNGNSEYWWTVMILAGFSILITEKVS